MSTRWYPIYQKGGPQLRVFLPNFWLKLVKPNPPQPSSVVQFACSMEMTKHDVKNYLEKIYNVKCIDVRTRIAMGKTKKDPGMGYVIKEEDTKYAYITLPPGETFQFPDLYPTEKLDEQKAEEEKTLEDMKKGHVAFKEKNKNRGNIPGWFNI